MTFSIDETSDLSEYAQKLIAYSEEAKREEPTATPDRWITVATNRMVHDYGTGRDHLGKIAMGELAAKFIFGHAA